MKNFIIENMDTIKTYVNKNHYFVIWNDNGNFKIRKINEDYGYCFENHIVTTDESFSELVTINHIDPHAILLHPNDIYYEVESNDINGLIKTIQCYYECGIGTVHDYIDEDILCAIDYFLEVYGQQ